MAPADEGLTTAGFLRRRLLPLGFLLLLFALLWARRPGPEPEGTRAVAAELLRLSGTSMGTTWHASVRAQGPAEPIWAAIQGALDQVDARMSTWKPDSELSRLNAAEAGAHPISDELAAVLAIATEVNLASSGAFDVTIGPLVDAWGFGPLKEGAPPSEEELAALRERIGPDRLVLSGPTEVQKLRADVHIDLSAVAKGHAVDRAALALDSLGLDNYMIEVGGEVRARGTNPDGLPWQLGIERPDGSSVVEEVVPLRDMALATSGDYRRYREVAGQRVAHTLDARTGQPLRHNLASVSVLDPSCAWADAWATALLVLGPDEGMALAERRQLPVLFILREATGFQTKTSTTWPRPAHSESP